MRLVFKSVCGGTGAGHSPRAGPHQTPAGAGVAARAKSTHGPTRGECPAPIRLTTDLTGVRTHRRGMSHCGLPSRAAVAYLQTTPSHVSTEAESHVQPPSAAQRPPLKCPGCPEPCTRQDNPPKQRCLTSDFWCPTFARSAGGPLLLKMAIGPKHKIWGRRPPASLQAGRRGATTGFAPPVTAQRWTCIDHRAAEGALPAAKSDGFHSSLEMDPWIWNSGFPR